MTFQSDRMTKAQLMHGLADGVKAKIVGNNTIEYMDGEDRVIRHFNTDVLRFKPDGTIVFNTNGHRSVTTKDRLNKYQDKVSIWTNNRVWYAAIKSHDATPVIFADGMSYHPKRGFEGCGVKPDRKLVNAIRKYANAFADSLPCDSPDGGDCWICCANSDDAGHLLSHIKESYYVPTLLLNAMREAQRGDRLIACAFKGDHRGGYYDQLLDSFRSQMAKDVYNYMYRRIVDGQAGERLPSSGFHSPRF